jgi:hypothetical protein
VLGRSAEVRFEVLMEASMKMAVFWVVALWSLAEFYRRFRGACCLHVLGDGGGSPDDGGRKNL